MSKLDDLFDTPVQQEQAYEPDAPFDKDAWAQKKQAERASAYEMIDRTAQNVGQDGAAFQTYLDVQSRFDRYSVGNVLLIMAQKPDATRLGDFDYWKENGGYPQKNQKGFTILEPGNEYTREDGSVGVSYNPKKVFDISQTTARAKAQPAVNRDDRTLIRALIYKAPVAVQSAEESGAPNKGAMFDPKQRAIFVQKGMNAGDMVRSIANELAHAEFANGDPAYDRNENAFKAYCVSYMLCQRNGIDTKGFDFSRMPEAFAEMDAQDIRAELSQIRDAANDIFSRMAKVLDHEKSARQQSHQR